jgi:hypothetical protein
LIERMYTAAERFFNLPIEVKQRVNIANCALCLDVAGNRDEANRVRRPALRTVPRLN